MEDKEIAKLGLKTHKDLNHSGLVEANIKF